MNKALPESSSKAHRPIMGGKNLRTLKEYARADYGLRVECYCGRVTILDPHDLLRIALLRRINLTLGVLAEKLRCQSCGRRPKQIGTAPR